MCVGDLFLPLPLLPAPPYPQVSALIEELAAGGSKELGVSLDSGVLERLLAYARSVAHFPTAIKEVGAPTPLVPLTWAACLCHPSLVAHACKEVGVLHPYSHSPGLHASATPHLWHMHARVSPLLHTGCYVRLLLLVGVGVLPCICMYAFMPVLLCGASMPILLCDASMPYCSAAHAGVLVVLLHHAGSWTCFAY